MSNENPQTHNNTPTSSTKDINLNVDAESNSQVQKVNLSLFSKSAIVFKPSSMKISSNDHSLNNQQKNMSLTQKNSSNFHALSTKYGSLIFPDQRPVKKKVSPKSKKVEISPVKQVETVTQQIKHNLSTIAENPTPENIQYIFKKPLFLLSLVNEGKIDTKIINTILPVLSKDDLYFFMSNMTMELTLHSSLAASYTFTDIEKNLTKILSFKKVLVWYKPYNSNFLISPTLKEIVPVSRSIVGYCALRQKKVITSDPAMSPGFDIDYDLPILRGTESMAIFPVISDYGDVSGVIQFVDLESQDKSAILPISKYEQSLLKLAVKLCKRQIFKDEGHDVFVTKELTQLLLFCGSGKTTSAITTNISNDQVKERRPSTSFSPTKSINNSNNYSPNSHSNESVSSSSISNQFDEKMKLNSCSIDTDDNYFYGVSFDFTNLVSSIIAFMKKYFDCDGVDIFEFDPNQKKFIRLTDEIEFSESGVGLSFLPIIKDEPVFVANGLQMGFPRSNLDKKFKNNSALTVAYKYKYNVLDYEEKVDIKRNEKSKDLKMTENQNDEIYTNEDENDPSIATSHFVFTLRSKWMLPSFLPDDLKKLNDISMILCSCIHNIQINRLKNAEIKRLQRENFLIRALGAALATYIDNKDEKWQILRKAVKEIFGASNCFVCSFDGMMIHFHPTDVTCKFDKCIAGKAYNFQELTEFVPTEKVEEKVDKKVDKRVSFAFDNVVVDKYNEIDEDLELYKKLGVNENLKKASAFHYLDGNRKVKGSIELINPTYPEIDLAGQKIIGIICSVINPF